MCQQVFEFWILIVEGLPVLRSYQLLESLAQALHLALSVSLQAHSEIPENGSGGFSPRAGSDKALEALVRTRGGDCVAGRSAYPDARRVIAERKKNPATAVEEDKTGGRQEGPDLLSSPTSQSV